MNDPPVLGTSIEDPSLVSFSETDIQEGCILVGLMVSDPDGSDHHCPYGKNLFEISLLSHAGVMYSIPDSRGLRIVENTIDRLVLRGHSNTLNNIKRLVVIKPPSGVFGTMEIQASMSDLGSCGDDATVLRTNTTLTLDLKPTERPLLFASSKYPLSYPNS